MVEYLFFQLYSNGIGGLGTVRHIQSRSKNERRHKELEQEDELEYHCKYTTVKINISNCVMTKNYKKMIL